MHNAHQPLEEDFRDPALSDSAVADPMPQSETAALLHVAIPSVDVLHSVEDMFARIEASQKRIQNLYELIPAMAHSVDAEGYLISVSNMWIERLGYERDEVIGRLSSDFLTEASREYARHVVLPQFFACGSCENIPYGLVSKSGEIINVELSAVLERDVDGTPLRSMAVLQDVTQRNAAMRANNALLSVIRTQFIMSITDAAGTIIEVNDAFCQVSQYSRDELLGKNHRILNSGHHTRDFFPSMWRRITGGQAWRGEICNRAKDGSIYWEDSIITPFIDGDGRIDRYVAIRTDVTKRREQEELLRKSESFLERTGNMSGVGGWEVDLKTGDVFWSAQTCRIHGLEPGHRPTFDEAIDYYPVEARITVRNVIEQSIRTREGWDIQVPLLQAGGRRIWVRSVGVAEFEQDQPIRLVGAFQDVTYLHDLLIDREAQRERLQVTLDSIGDAVITTDAYGLVDWLNPVAERMTGWLNADALGQPIASIFKIVNEESRSAMENPVDICLKTGKLVRQANCSTLVARNGQEFGIQDSAAPMLSKDGTLLGVVLVFHDVTQQRLMAKEMAYRATHDALTGLLNRTECESRIQRALRNAQQEQTTHALLYIDLDQFKLVNDACGHSVGDNLLIEVSTILMESVRNSDTVARMGGDEFALILEQCSTQLAQRIAQKICDRMDDFRFVHEGRRFRIGASIGMVLIDSRWEGTAAILQAADTSCYAAKEAGRNRVHTWLDTDVAMRERHGEMEWASRIEIALDESRFELYAQRIIPIGMDNNGIHAEVLLRMVERDGELIQPGSFLPAAERFNLIGRIDRWVMRHAIDWLLGLPDLSAIHTLSINLSGQSVGDSAFHHHAIQVLNGTDRAVCGKICFEITETAAITNLAGASQFIEQVRSLGARIALDDFGAGASSFGYLKNLPVDYLKIDGQFIRDLMTDSLDDAAVRCFVDVAKVVGVTTVAEFVDKPDVLSRLEEIGVDYAQGFLLHRPEPIHNLFSFPTTANKEITSC